MSLVSEAITSDSGLMPLMGVSRGVVSPSSMVVIAAVREHDRDLAPSVFW